MRTTGKKELKLEGEVAYASVQSSEMERLAEEAEREVDDLKKAEYMSANKAEVYDGIITLVTAFWIILYNYLIL